jgi:membrane fusion protein, heavy metal efflux system
MMPLRPKLFSAFLWVLSVAEVEDDMNDHEPLAMSSSKRRDFSRIWPSLLAGGAVFAVLAVWLNAVRTSGDAAPPGVPSDAQTSQGVFHPNGRQWANLKAAPALPLAFHTEHVTDGKIAINEDMATPVFSPYSGRVTRLIAKPGQIVKAGDPLFAVQASEIVQGQNDLILATATANKARKQLDQARVTENRQHELYLAKAAALKDWQQSQVDLTSADNDARSAETAVAAVRHRLKILGKSDDEIKAFENTAKMNAEAEVAAPIGGTVIQRKVGLGQYIQAGAADPQFSIGDLSSVWLVANVRETDAPLMRPGEPVEVRLIAYPDKVFKARIAYVAPSVDANTHRLPVRAEVENPGGALKPEMFARFAISSSDDTMAPAVSQDAVVYEGDKARVWVAQADHSVVLRPIAVGRTKDDMVEVLNGLAAGEQVVTNGALFIDRAAHADNGAGKS